MNNKIKVIELLNIIANGKDIPEKIKYDGKVFIWQEPGYLHCEENDTRIVECTFLDGWRTDMVLNHYVEILEDEKEIDIETKLFDDIEMCLKRLSDFQPEINSYVDRYKYDLSKYRDKKINKED